MFLQVCVCPQGVVSQHALQQVSRGVSLHALQVVSQHALQQVLTGGACLGGCLLPGGACSQGVPAPGSACSQGGFCSGGWVWRRPPGQQTATDADGTHSTGMHFCFHFNFIFFFQDGYFHFPFTSMNSSPTIFKLDGSVGDTAISRHTPAPCT